MKVRKISGSFDKESSWNAGDPGLTLWSGRSPGEGNGNSLQYSYLGNLMDRGAGGIFQARVLEWGAIAFSTPSYSFLIFSTESCLVYAHTPI